MQIQRQAGQELRHKLLRPHFANFGKRLVKTSNLSLRLRPARAPRL
jgi:hypothetical protein